MDRKKMWRDLKFRKSNVKEEIGKVAVIMTEKEMNDYKK